MSNEVIKVLTELTERFSKAIKESEEQIKNRETDKLSIIETYLIKKRAETHKIGLYFSPKLYDENLDPYILKKITQSQISIDIYDINFRDAQDAERYLRTEARKEHYYFGKEIDNERN